MISATNEQKKILETVKNSKDNLLIAAFAGSGKTTTLQMISKELSHKKDYTLHIINLYQKQQDANFQKI